MGDDLSINGLVFGPLFVVIESLHIWYIMEVNHRPFSSYLHANSPRHSFPHFVVASRRIILPDEWGLPIFSWAARQVILHLDHLTKKIDLVLREKDVELIQKSFESCHKWCHKVNNKKKAINIVFTLNGCFCSYVYKGSKIKANGCVQKSKKQAKSEKKLLQKKNRFYWPSTLASLANLL